MAFDAGSVEASLTVRTDQFNKDIDAAEARVREFEKNRHEVKIAAVFDQSSLSLARRQFAQLDQQVSKDAMSRLRSSPQGSVLGALNALFSPHPVTGAPSAQQAATQGLLGKMISAPGGGGPSSGGGGGSTVRTVLNQAAAAASPAGPAVKQAVTGQAPGNVTTTDTIKRDITGTAPGDVTTTDTIKERLDPDAAAKVEADSKASGDRSGTGWLASFTGHLKNLLPSSSTAPAEKAAGDSGDRSGTRFFAGMSGHLGPFFAGFVKSSGDAGQRGGTNLGSGLLGGIGPGILGISAKVSGITGLVGSALGALPALAGVAGTGMGVALLGGLVAEAVKGSPKLVASFKSLGVQAATMFKEATAPIIPAMSAVLNQVPALLKSIEPQLAGISAAVAPQLQQVFAGLIPLVQGLLGVMQAAAPAFGPFIAALEGLISNVLPGISTVIKATIPFVSQFAGILGTLGRDLGSLFSTAAPAIGASMQILSGLLGLLGDLLPAVMKIADIFATALAPVFVTFTGVIRTLVPPLVQLGSIIASFAGAVIGDLAAAFSAVARLIAALTPSLTILTTTLGGVFTVMENAGVFAVLGNALEGLVVPLANVVNALVTGLAPALPAIIGAAGQLVTVLAGGLAAAIGAVLTALTPVVAFLAQAVTAVTGFLQSTGLLLPVMAGLGLAFGPVASGLKAMAAGIAAFAGSGFVAGIAGIVTGIRDFTAAAAGATAAEKAMVAGELLMEAISPLGWAVIGVATVAALVIGLQHLQDGIGGTVTALAKQDNAVGYNIDGYQKLAAQTAALGDQQAKAAESIGTSAAKGAGVVRQVVAGNAAAYSAVSAQTAELAANMDARLTALSGSFGVSQTQIEKWATAAGISAQKFGGAGESVGLLTKQIGAFVDKNAEAITAAASLGTNIAIFGGDVYSATTQLDAFNQIWNTLVGNLLTKQMAVTQGQQSFDNLKTSITQSGTASTTSKQAFQDYIQQIQSSLDALEKGGASVSDLNGYLQTQIDHLSSLHNLSPGEQQDLANLKTFQDDLANSTHGLTDAQQTLIGQFENNLIPDLNAMHANTPAVTTDISNLANSIIQTGNNSASTAGDRAALIKDLEDAGVSASTAKGFVDTLQGSIDNLKGKVVTVGVTATAQGTLNAISHLAGQNPSTSILTLSSAANGMLVSGGVPGKDSVLAMLMPGEVVVPTAMVRGGAVDHLKGSIPGFAAGGMVNLDGPGSWAASNEGTWGTAVANMWAQAVKSAFDTAAAAAALAAANAFISSGGASGGAIQEMFVNLAAARGWTGAELNALLAVEAREAGFNMTAQNPTSSAYGLAQFIGGAAEYAQYGGNSTTATGQITAMLNYIQQRYGDPIAAEAHEQCVPVDVEILTRRGWLTYDQLQYGDETVGYDIETGRSKWTLIEGVHVYEDAALVRLSNKTWEATCTPHHRWVATKHKHVGRAGRDGRVKNEYVKVDEFVAAEKITSRHAIRLAAAADLGDGPAISEGEAELLGWVMGDGSVAHFKSNGRPNNRWKAGGAALVSIRLYQSKPQHVAMIDELVRGMLFTRMVRQMRKPDGTPGLPLVTWEFTRPYSAELLKRSGYNHKNPVPFVLSLNEAQRTAFMRGVFGAEGNYAGDGSIKGVQGYPRTKTYSQNDGPKQDAIILGVYLSGSRPGISERDNRGAMIGRWTTSTVAAVIRETKPVVGGERVKCEDAGRGPVWCVTTRLGSWTMRQGREVMLTGNSYGWYDRGGYLQPGYTMAYNGTGRPELVTPGGAGGASFDDVVSRLDKLIRATEQVPAGVGAHVGGALNGAAHDASFRSRYPRGGG